MSGDRFIGGRRNASFAAAMSNAVGRIRPLEFINVFAVTCPYPLLWNSPLHGISSDWIGSSNSRPTSAGHQESAQLIDIAGFSRVWWDFRKKGDCPISGFSEMGTVPFIA